MKTRFALVACTLLLSLVASLPLPSAGAEAGPLDVAILSPGGLVRGEWNLTARATGEAANLTFRIDDGPETPLPPSGNGDFTALVNTTALADGIHSVTVAAIGPNGTHDFAGVGLDVDNAPPAVHVRWPPIRNVTGDMAVEVSVRDVHLDGAVVGLVAENATVRTFPVPSTGVPGEHRLVLDTLVLENRTYAMRVTAVDGAGNSNVSEVREFEVRNHPDLVLRWLDHFNDPLVVQRTYSLTFEVTNAGTVAADGFAVGLFWAGHFETSIVHNRTLGPGAKVRLVMSYTPSGVSNAQDLRAVVDPDNVVVETSESNNAVTQRLRVVQAQAGGCNGIILVMAVLLPAIVVSAGGPKGGTRGGRRSPPPSR